MIDNRLDLILNLKDETHAKIAYLREYYIALDAELVRLGASQIGHRNLAIARTELEQSLMNAIKVMCLQGEIKKNES